MHLNLWYEMIFFYMNETDFRFSLEFLRHSIKQHFTK